jgi:hypothetical protein
MFVNWQVCRPVTYSLKDRGEGGRRREKEGEGGRRRWGTQYLLFLAIYNIIIQKEI